MKKILAFISAVLLTVTLATAGNTNSTSMFSGKELSFDTFAAYQSSASWGYGVGLTYYQTENLGVAVWTSKQDFDWGTGQFIQNVDLSLRYRVPITDVVAPYATLGSRWYGNTPAYCEGNSCYSASTEDRWVPVAGLGVEYRVTKRIGLFAEGTYGFGEWGRWSLPQWKDVGVRLGVKLGF